MVIDESISTILEASRAEEDFKQAVLNFENGENPHLISYSPGSPRIKVMRVLLQLLETFPEQAISQVNIEGQSSCSSYSGRLTFGPDNTEIYFNWDCSWRAKQEGFVTWYGAPDQTKAAQKFGFRCFETFKVVEQ